MTTKEPVGTVTDLLMTTLAQEGLTKDTDILRTVVQHNKVQVGAMRVSFPARASTP